MVWEGGDNGGIPIIWKEFPGDFETAPSTQWLSYHSNLEGLKPVIVKELWFKSLPTTSPTQGLFYGCLGNI